jgi:hypothetical protein
MESALLLHQMFSGRKYVHFIVHLKWWNNNLLQSSVRSKMQQLSDMVNKIVNQTNTWKKNKKKGYCSLC